MMRLDLRLVVREEHADAFSHVGLYEALVRVPFFWCWIRAVPWCASAFGQHVASQEVR
jgi:hypothetical protein